MKKMILERYSPASSYLHNRQKLSQMRFNVNGNDTLASFIDRYVALSKRSGINNEHEIVTGILITLPPEVHGELEYLGKLRGVSTIIELMELVHRYDSIVAKRINHSDLSQISALVSSVSKEELGKALQSIRDEFKLQHEETLAAINIRGQQGGSRLNSSQRRCYNCQDVGHLVRDCPKPRDMKTNNDSRNVESRQQPRRDWTQANHDAIKEYESKFGKPEIDCPICKGYHFVYHCPLKTLKE